MRSKKQPHKKWSPTREQQAARRTMIRSLVKRDSDRLFDQLVSALPLKIGNNKDQKLEQSLRELQRRSPLLQWHVNNNVLPADMPSLLPPKELLPLLPLMKAPRGKPSLGLPRSRTPHTPYAASKHGKTGLSTTTPKATTKSRAKSPAKPKKAVTKPSKPNTRARMAKVTPSQVAKPAPPKTAADADTKGPGLKEAVLEVTPVFFSLVSSAAKSQPSRYVGLYRRVASALVVLGWWNLGRTWGAGPKRQYPLMNDFLERIVSIVAECEGILGCDGDQGCVIEAVEAQKRELDQEVRRVSTRPSLQRTGRTQVRARAVASNGKK